jgi:hypothetical protein
MNKKILGGVLVLCGVLAGAAGSVAFVTSAQTTTPNVTTTTPVVQSATNEQGEKAHGQAPLGGDGIVQSVNGTTIIVGEEANEGGASYTIDASKATFTKDGNPATISDVTVGSKVFVEGSVNGTNVVATSVSLGHHGHESNGKEAADDNGKDAGGSANETEIAD